MKNFRIVTGIFGALMLSLVTAPLLLGDRAIPWVIGAVYVLVPLGIFMLLFFLVKLFRSGLSIAKRKPSPKHPVI